VFVLLLLAGRAQAQSVDLDNIGLHGGLIVQLGASELDTVAELSQTGRYLIHVLEPNEELVRSAQAQLHSKGRYGMAWAETFVTMNELPYAENLVNLVVIRDFTVPMDELVRVLVPGGTLAVAEAKLVKQSSLEAAGFVDIEQANGILVARKPWPSGMDVWSHPRHDADGNAVSGDTLVGPPTRIRWIAAATAEVEGLVTAGGRNFYGGILSRDSFNGLRLWHRDLRTGRDVDSKQFSLPRLSRDGPRPIASQTLLFAVMNNRPVALNPQTGEVVVEYGDMGTPTALIHKAKHVIAADSVSVRAFDAVKGQQLWKVETSAPRNIVADEEFVAVMNGQPRRGEKTGVLVIQSDTGKILWQRDDYVWLARTARTVLAKGLLVFEASSLSDHDADNGIHVVAADTGDHIWSRNYPPGMNHNRQARAMFLGEDLWILHRRWSRNTSSSR